VTLEGDISFLGLSDSYGDDIDIGATATNDYKVFDRYRH
jgi:hypothetical protein